MTNLCGLYIYGLGVETNYYEARNRCNRAAGLGSPRAMFYLGVMYENGHGVPRDLAQARTWFEKAAAGGHEGAKARLNR
jgi:TPR repeat protein